MRHSKRGMTLVEVVSVLAILAVLAAILLPVVVASRRRASESACISNLSQINHAIAMYLSDYDGIYPPVSTGIFVDNQTSHDSTWVDVMLPYLGKPTMLRCPEVQVPTRLATIRFQNETCGYGYNELLNQPLQSIYRGSHEGTVQWPTTTIVLGEVRAGLIGMKQPDTGAPGPLLSALRLEGFHEEIIAQVLGAKRHHGGANYAFADGHTRWLIPSQILFAAQGDGTHPSLGP